MRKRWTHNINLILLAVAVSGMVSAEVYNMISSDRVLAYVRRYRPDVNITHYPRQITADRGEPVYSGDTLTTDKNGFAAVQFMDKSFAKVKPQSRLIVYGQIESPRNTSTRIALEVGEIFLEITQRGQKDFEVETTTAVASVKGTVFGAREADNYFWVEEGAVELRSKETGQTVLLTENMFGQVTDDNSIITGTLTQDEIDDLRDDYEKLEDNLVPKKLKFQFRDADGQIREIDLNYFENGEN